MGAPRRHGNSSELHLDDHVFARSMYRELFEAEGPLGYSVSDGDRSGVYLARLPPRAANP